MNFFHPGSRIRTQKKVSKLSEIRSVRFCSSRIPDPGVNKAPDAGSGSATLFKIFKYVNLYGFLAPFLGIYRNFFSFIIILSLHFTLLPGEIRSLALDGEEIELTGGVRLSLLRDRLTVFCGAAHARPDPPPQDTNRGQLFKGWGRSTSASLVAANKQKLI
jgi:hypothetical protein